jgi:UDP-N-acetylmuramyl pentapeptide phosphotransferase/UDP-N-acetylglucosamine-1-phosphate transferase
MAFHPILLVVFSTVLAFVIVFVSVPSIVNVAHIKKLYDEPSRRKSHTQCIPNLGGISIFAGFILGSGLFLDIVEVQEIVYLYVAIVVIFFVGIKDDILVIAPVKKLYGEIIAAIIIVVIGDFRFTNLHGFIGMNEITYIPSILLTIFVMVVIINAFNLIDGIDGLAAGIGVLVSFTFGLWFFLVGQVNYAVISAALFGAFTSFFWYNVFGKNNKIFMGDTGSLILGLVISVIVIKFNEINVGYSGPFKINSAPAVSFGILIVPLFDTLRVFIIRISRMRSPFKPDKNHFHHRLLKLGFSHFSSTLFLILLNLLVIVIAYTCQDVGLEYLMIINISLAMLISFVIELFIKKSKNRQISHQHNHHHARA